MADNGEALLEELDAAIGRSVPDVPKARKAEFEENMANAHRALIIILQKHERVMREMEMGHLVDFNHISVKNAAKVVEAKTVMGIFPTMPAAEA